MNITFICSPLCGGKSTLAQQLRQSHITSGRSFVLEISTIVQQLVSETSREKLQGRPELDTQIIEEIKSFINDRLLYSDNLIVLGARQVSILKAFPDATLIWLEVPEHIRFNRYMVKRDIKDGIKKDEETFKIANQRDNDLGLQAVKEYIFNENK